MIETTIQRWLRIGAVRTREVINTLTKSYVSDAPTKDYVDALEARIAALERRVETIGRLKT